MSRILNNNVFSMVDFISKNLFWTERRFNVKGRERALESLKRDNDDIIVGDGIYGVREII